MKAQQILSDDHKWCLWPLTRDLYNLNYNCVPELLNFHKFFYFKYLLPYNMCIDNNYNLITVFRYLYLFLHGKCSPFLNTKLRKHSSYGKHVKAYFCSASEAVHIILSIDYSHSLHWSAKHLTIIRHAEAYYGCLLYTSRCV